MTEAEVADIVNRKQVEKYRRLIIAANRRRAYEAEHDRRLREATAGVK